MKPSKPFSYSHVYEEHKNSRKEQVSSYLFFKVYNLTKRTSKLLLVFKVYKYNKKNK